MRYTYRLGSDPEGIVATCVEVPVSVTAPDEAAAVSALQVAICEHFTRVEAVAPPSSVAVPSIQLEPARDTPGEPQGPGDSAAAERV